MERKNLKKNVIIAHYFSPELNYKYKIRFTESKYWDLMNRRSFELGQKYFPIELNETNDFLSFIRYDGYYRFKECFDNTCENGRTLFVRFFPNKTAIIVQKNEIVERNDIWNDTSYIVNHVDFLNASNIPANSFKIIDSNLTIIAKGKFTDLGMTLEHKRYEQGPFLRHYLNFVKD